MKCEKCGKEIEFVKVAHEFTTNIIECKCGSHSLHIPSEHFNSAEDIKCPECGNYPFKMDPVSIVNYTEVVIDVNEEVDIL